MRGISVVCCCHGRERALKQWLESIEVQTVRSSIEAVVVTDEPMDGPFVNVVAPQFRGPFPEAWWKNIGIRAATHDVVATTNADITYRPDFFEKVLSCVAPHKLVQAIRLDAPEGLFIGPNGVVDMQRCSMTLDFDAKVNEMPVPITACGDLQAMYKEDWDRLSGFHEQLTGWGVADVDLSVRAIFAGMSVEYIGTGKTLHIHRGHPTDTEKNGWDAARNRALAVRSLRTVGFRPNGDTWGTITGRA